METIGCHDIECTGWGDNQGFLVTVRAGTAYRHLFFQVKKKQLFVMYIVNE